MPRLTRRSSIARASARPDPRRMLLPGLCATEAPWSPSRAMSSLSSQTPCATEKCGPRHAEPVEVRRLRHAVDADAGHRLHLRLGEVALQAEIEIAGEPGATE